MGTFNKWCCVHHHDLNTSWFCGVLGVFLDVIDDVISRCLKEWPQNYACWKSPPLCDIWWNFEVNWTSKALSTSSYVWRGQDILCWKLGWGCHFDSMGQYVFLILYLYRPFFVFGVVVVVCLLLCFFAEKYFFTYLFILFFFSFFYFF